ncbi:MATE family efflux transporter [Legionella bononiensis]|uniref:Multidrug-efflux transporter n=1 Tax=Legionella bononiensis TaxID=2793102 RepID=A0ABS1WBX2_9GAMM|nr:MATE family efflux transporter [Legionella bononiensis]MBL7481145.1 MATE family efflux transporter [Legionella bononiensis]MBL7526854.1 MATE family efflux transporter [Legionella bononiensis]MBL7564261.1 MATE family efflux transporter [Legionella bononiensis]
MKLFKDNFYPLIKLAIPLALTGLMQSSVWFFETMFLARLGPDILAAGSLVSWLFGTVVVILFGTLSSINILVAHKHGADDTKGILHVVRDGFWLALLLALPIFLLFWNMSPLFLVFGQSPAIVQLAKTYLHAMAWGVLPNVVMIALLEVIMGLGRARFILVFNIISVTLTIFFSFAFIFGRFGFPPLGIAGAGWGLTTSYWITTVFLTLYVITNKNYSCYFRLLLKPTKPSYLIELVRIGVPMGMMYCVEVAFFFALTLIMGSFGSLVISANQIALQYLGTLMSLIFSLAQSITVRMGHLLGSGNKASAERTGYIGILIAASLMLLVAIIYWTIPTALINIDFDVHNSNNRELVRIATQLLTISALFQLIEAIRIALFGALRALKDTHFTLGISIISFWGVALPLGYFMASHMNLGGAGLWWGMVLGAGFSVLLLLWRFKVKIRTY